MNLRTLHKWSTPGIDALTISSSTYQVPLLPIACSQRSHASMYKGLLIHSLHCSEFVELTLLLQQPFPRKVSIKKPRSFRNLVCFVNVYIISVLGFCEAHPPLCDLHHFLPENPGFKTFFEKKQCIGFAIPKTRSTFASATEKRGLLLWGCQT